MTKARFGMWRYWIDWGHVTYSYLVLHLLYCYVIWKISGDRIRCSSLEQSDASGVYITRNNKVRGSGNGIWTLSYTSVPSLTHNTHTSVTRWVVLLAPYLLHWWNGYVLTLDVVRLNSKYQPYSGRPTVEELLIMLSTDLLFLECG
jgi:hypothetical protein